MTIPTKQQAYGSTTGTVTIPAFIFSTVDPTNNNTGYPLYTGWVNTTTKALWYLEGFNSSSSGPVAQWRAVGPIVVSSVSPTTSDYNYPIGQTWINTVGQTYWGLVNLTPTTPPVATWVDLSGGGGSGILTLTGDSGGAVGPDGLQNINILGTANQIVVTGDPGTHTLTLSLAGSGQAIDSVNVDDHTAPGTDPVVASSDGSITVTGGQVPAATTANVIQTNSLAANTYTIQVQRTQATAVSTVGSNGVSHFNEADFTVDNNGYVSALSSGYTREVEVDTHSAPGTDPVLPNASGVITVTGGQVAAGTTTNAIQTNSLAANTWTVQIQRSQAVGSSTIGDNGICHFDSGAFSVDSNGFVTLKGGTEAIDSITVDAFTGPGTNPVLPNVSGNITVTGAQVAAGTTTNVIRTDSLAANTYTIEIQRSQAVASTTIGDNGVCHFDSGAFNVDANGFVSLKGGSQAIDSVGVDAATGPGTNPVLPNASGLITVTGGQVAAGTTTNVIRTDSLAANTYTVEVQRSQAVASTTIGDNGVCHFNSAYFSVDGNGFVSLVSGLTGVLSMQIFVAGGTYTPTSGMNYCIIECWGGGGGGAGATDGGISGGGGGGQGEYTRGIFSAADIGASKPVTIGASGVAGAAGSGGGSGGNGGAGGATSVGALISANPGSGGMAGTLVANPLGIGGDGGSGTVISGVFSIAGQPGFTGLTSGTGAISGAGGGGGGGKAIAVLNLGSGAGNQGVGYGSGGSGGATTATTSGTAGGAGKSGLVVITELS